MPFGEFDAIRRFFSRPVPAGVLGPGDDCALLPPSGQSLAISTDLLIEGRHFFPDVHPRALGHKALAVNLSDLAAMGAQPLGCVLGLALPSLDEAWLSEFSAGWYALADAAACPLVGGDTTRSVAGITLSVTVFGAVPEAQALRRSAARAGDEIWVSGQLGEASLALRLLQGDRLGWSGAEAAERLAQARRALEWPQPQLALGQALRGRAHAALDISDGLLQDLGHILSASGCAARLAWPAIPLGPSLAGLPAPLQQAFALSGGDEYQLCFTAAPSARQRILAAAQAAGVAVHCIGAIEAGRGLMLLDEAGRPLPLPDQRGFDHFS
ncbi:MAG: thiamine-phosphate kinase [Pigmentiphaga sp.]